MKIDLHMHSTYSDGTDTPEELLQHVQQAGIQLFSLTDHDGYQGCLVMQSLLAEKRSDTSLNETSDLYFIPGIELSARKDRDKFHILGYACDYTSSLLSQTTKKMHASRIKKMEGMLDYLQKSYGFTFMHEDIRELMSLSNPGKPHLANLMIRYGYVSSISEGISDYLNHYRQKDMFISPEEAVEAILDAGGIPVLAHGIFGSGSQYLTEKELDERVGYLKSLGLMGMECYYGTYTPLEQQITRRLCQKHHLLATAGSDYHGTNKAISLGEHHLNDASLDPDVEAFLALCRERVP